MTAPMTLPSGAHAIRHQELRRRSRRAALQLLPWLRRPGIPAPAVIGCGALDRTPRRAPVPTPWVPPVVPRPRYAT